MADVQPLRALRYDLAVAGALEDLVTPPYDVVGEAQRAELAARSPHNVVHVDLPRGPEPYATAARRLRAWQDAGVLRRDDALAMWALEQRFVDGTGAPRVRRGVLARVRLEPYGPGTIRPHEATHPEPLADRLALTRATAANLSPVFLLHPGDAHGALTAGLGDAPPALEVAHDADGAAARAWRVTDPERLAATQEVLRDATLLVADGHHRYEAARSHADAIGGDGPHRYVLAALVSLDDPGLVVDPTHRLLTDLGDPSRQRALGATLKEHFDVTPTTLEALRPPPDPGGPVAFGYLDAHVRRPFRLTLKDPQLPSRLLSDLPAPLRDLDVALLEALVLRGPAGLSADDVAHLRGLRYARSDAEALSGVLDGRADCGFWVRPVPIAQVVAVAAAGATMPPKSTSFAPKIPSGLVLSPLS